MNLAIIILTLTAFFSFTTTQSISSSTDLTALYNLRSSLSLRARDWPRAADPCSNWTGVSCDSAGRVISLNLYGLRRTRVGRLNPRFAIEGIKNLTFLNYFNTTGFSLPGSIPVWFGQFNPKLSVVDFSRSSISGEIPASLGNLSSLVSIDLSHNSLNGSLPDSLKELQSLKNLNFGRNSLSGSIKSEIFSSFRMLESVTLSGNNFSGLIPGSILSLPELKFFDVSHNNFTGYIPDVTVKNFSRNGIGFDLSHNFLYGSISSEFYILLSRFNFVDISNNYFEGSEDFDRNNRNISISLNCFLNDSSQRSTAECEQFYNERGIAYDGTVNSKSKKTWKYILIAVVCGSVFLVFIVSLIVMFIMKCRVHSGDHEMKVDAAVAGGQAQSSQLSVKLPSSGEAFTYERLAVATSDFGEENLIKNGHSGDLYHGVLEDGSLVVVKRIDKNNVRMEDHLVELDLFGRSSHERLIALLGHCLQNEDEKFLVYKQMPHRDLSYALYKKAELEEDGLQSLDWITRLKIAIGVAEALCHLHYDFSPPFVHRDIQSSSILLDDRFEVRLGSLSSVCAEEVDDHQNVISRFFRFSQKSSDQNPPDFPSASCAYDAYCFGKILLELVTGKLGISAPNNSSTNAFLEHTLQHIDINDKDLVTKIVDPSLVIYEDLLEEVWAMSIVAKSCLNPQASKRPGMKYVRRALENPLKVVRDESNSDSMRIGDSSSGRSWNAPFFGSLTRSGGLRSQASGGDFSNSKRRLSKEIVPEPSGVED